MCCQLESLNFSGLFCAKKWKNCFQFFYTSFSSTFCQNASNNCKFAAIQRNFVKNVVFGRKSHFFREKISGQCFQKSDLSAGTEQLQNRCYATESRASSYASRRATPRSWSTLLFRPARTRASGPYASGSKVHLNLILIQSMLKVRWVLAAAWL